MPQARHGGRGVFAFADAGSKFDGTGFEKEHIGQIHVAFEGTDGVGASKDDRKGLANRVPREGFCSNKFAGPEPKNELGRRFAFG